METGSGASSSPICFSFLPLFNLVSLFLQVAQRLQDMGRDIRPGMEIQYAVCLPEGVEAGLPASSQKIADRAFHPDEIKRKNLKVRCAFDVPLSSASVEEARSASQNAVARPLALFANHFIKLTRVCGKNPRCCVCPSD